MICSTISESDRSKLQVTNIMTPPNTFTITAAPGTDIWRKPPTTDVFNGKH